MIMMMMMMRSRRERTTTMMMMMIMEFVPVLKTRSDLEEEAGTVNTFFATFDRIGKIVSCPLHHSRTLLSLWATVKVSYWIISLLMGGIRLRLRC